MTYFVPRSSRRLGVTQDASTSGKQCPSFPGIKAVYCTESAGGDLEFRIAKEPGGVDSSFITQAREPHVVLVHSVPTNFSTVTLSFADRHSCHTIKTQSTYHTARRHSLPFRTDTLGCQMRKRIVINLPPVLFSKQEQQNHL